MHYTTATPRVHRELLPPTCHTLRGTGGQQSDVHFTTAQHMLHYASKVMPCLGRGHVVACCNVAGRVASSESRDAMDLYTLGGGRPSSDGQWEERGAAEFR